MSIDEAVWVVAARARLCCTCLTARARYSGLRTGLKKPSYRVWGGERRLDVLLTCARGDPLCMRRKNDSAAMMTHGLHASRANHGSPWRHFNWKEGAVGSVDACRQQGGMAAMRCVLGIESVAEIAEYADRGMRSLLSGMQGVQPGRHYGFQRNTGKWR